jgi:NADH-quinone oxidoreductase subunit C
MINVEQARARILEKFPGATVTLIANDAPNSQASLLLENARAFEIARFLRDDAALKLDYLSNATGVDFLDAVLKQKIKTKKMVEGVEKEVEETIETPRAGYLEAVYHLYSMALKQGPLVIRLRTENRTDKVHLPSMTPLWRSAEFQEREIFDLYGIVFDGHPDLRRILMWDGFKDYPMRKDYAEPDDYEYEPTPHDDVLAKAKKHYPAEVKA